MGDGNVKSASLHHSNQLQWSDWNEVDQAALFEHWAQESSCAQGLDDQDFH
jgi:hypothetical protein